MKFAVIGPGAMGTMHTRAFAELGELEPWVVAGAHARSTEEFASEHGFRHHTTDHRDVVTDDAVDLVVVASPNATHYEHALAAIQAGKHVLIEIPIAMSVAHAEELAAAAEESPAVVMAGHLSRYYPAIRTQVAGAREGSLTVRHLICAMGTDKRRNKNWLGQDRDWVDHLVWHHGMHVFDTILQLVPSEIVSVRAVGGAKHPQHGGAMDAACLVEFASGAVATVALTYHAVEQFTRYTIVADEGFFEYAQDAPGIGRNELTQGMSFADLVLSQDREFVLACKEGSPSPVPIGDVLPAMRLAGTVDELLSDQPAPIAST